MDARHTVERYYEAWAAGDLDAIRALVDDALVVHTGAASFGRDELLAFRADLAARLGPLDLVTREVVVQDDRVATAWTNRGVDAGTGTPVEWRGITHYRVVGGRVAEIRDVTEGRP